MTDVSGLTLSTNKYRHNKDCAKMLMHMVLSDRYRITQGKFQYQGV